MERLKRWYHNDDFYLVLIVAVIPAIIIAKAWLF